jgi:hypothetical protein
MKSATMTCFVNFARRGWSRVHAIACHDALYISRHEAAGGGRRQASAPPACGLHVWKEGSISRDFQNISRTFSESFDTHDTHGAHRAPLLGGAPRVSGQLGAEGPPVIHRWRAVMSHQRRCMAVRRWVTRAKAVRGDSCAVLAHLRVLRNSRARPECTVHCAGRGARADLRPASHLPVL